MYICIYVEVMISNRRLLWSGSTSGRSPVTRCCCRWWTSCGATRWRRCSRSEWVWGRKTSGGGGGRRASGEKTFLMSDLLLFSRPGRDGLQQRGAPVPPARDREQRGRDVLRRRHGPRGREEEEEEEEGARHPDHRLSSQRTPCWIPEEVHRGTRGGPEEVHRGTRGGSEEVQRGSRGRQGERRGSRGGPEGDRRAFGCFYI